MFSIRNNVLNFPLFFIKRGLGGVCVCLLLAGCSIGPKYVRPTAQIPAIYKEAKDWKKAHPQDEMIRGEWWKIFNNPQLDALENQVNISNQNIAVAEAQYAQAYALVQAAKSAIFPILGTSASYTRSHGSSGGGGGASNSKSAVSSNLLNADVSWE